MQEIVQTNLWSIPKCRF